MPLNVRRFCTSVLLVLVSFIISTQAQTVSQAPSQTPPQTLPPTLPTSGDVMRERISKAKAFIAVRNYNAAIYDLENIRRETNDATVNGVVNVLLMNSYLEQGDYKRAQDFLTEFYNAQKTTKPNALALYVSIAGQVVKGARNRVERYRALGLNISDRTLPLEALNDIEKMRETLELVITQSKEIGKEKSKTPDAMALIEEASNSRSVMARDDYDARRWKDEVADSREQIASSQSVVLSAVNETPGDTTNSTQIASTNGANTSPAASPGKLAETPIMLPVGDTKTNTTRDREVKPPDNKVAENDKPVFIPSAPSAVKDEPKINADPKPQIGSVDGGPIDVGSLIGYATKQSQPVYPPAAKNIRATGIVKVEVTINEAGEVAEVQKASGPALLQAAAKDAIRKWKFRPFVRDGQPVRAIGFVSFNFAL